MKLMNYVIEKYYPNITNDLQLLATKNQKIAAIMQHLLHYFEKTQIISQTKDTISFFDTLQSYKNRFTKSLLVSLQDDICYDQVQFHLCISENITQYHAKKYIINLDKFEGELPQNVVTYGTDIDADYIIKDVMMNNEYSSFVIEYKNQAYTFKTLLLGIENVYAVVASIVGVHEKSLVQESISKITLDRMQSMIGLIDKNIGKMIIEKISDRLYAFDMEMSQHSVFSLMNLLENNIQSKVAVINITNLQDYKKYSLIAGILEKVCNQIIWTSNQEEAIREFVATLKKEISIPSLIVEQFNEAIRMAHMNTQEDDFVIVCSDELIDINKIKEKQDEL